MGEDKIYEQMLLQATPLLLSGNNTFDPYLEKNSKLVDTRRGITLLAKFSDLLVTQISQYLDEFSVIEPGHYCQPPSDLHMTVLSIVTCREHYQFSPDDLASYVSLIQSAKISAIQKCCMNLSSKSYYLLVYFVNKRQP